MISSPTIPQVDITFATRARLSEAEDVAELGYIDLHTGECKLIITYERLAREFPEARERRKTLLLTSYLEGNLYKLNDYNIDSHYHWKNDRELIMLYGSATEQEGLYYMEDLTKKRVHIPEKAFYDDIHCLYSPDRRFFSGDGYPFNHEGNRPLWLYDIYTDICYELALVHSTEYPSTDLRCDLHARWSPDGKKLSFDSNATGSRTICEMDLTETLENILNS